ncbi:MAG: U32 family peptidase [Candidatus Bruticola sp.]
MFKPEVLAPVGDYQVLQAALQAGADAVYFGLSEGFNARARAQNFTLAKLQQTVDEIHSSGAKAYITLNTLVFEDELDKLKTVLQKIEECKVDALIVQDLGVARMASRWAPSVRLHASTQMTISDSCGASLAQNLGFQRVVLARELSTDDIASLKKDTDCELEVFALGALCVSFSGQCLASLAWGGRSANRGQCAQPCRLPFRWTALPHGQTLDFSSGRVKLSSPSHLLSPCDLAGFSKVADLIKAQVSSLKIEGRLKGAAYVYMAVKTMRSWIDAHFDMTGRFHQPEAAQILELRRNISDLNVTFSRGFTPGFLSSVNHQTFTQKGYPKHRGQLLGTVTAKNGYKIRVKLSSCGRERRSAEAASIVPQNGMGVLFLSEQTEQSSAEEVQGGPIFSCSSQAGEATLGFSKPGPDLSKVKIGDLVYITSSPATIKRLNQSMHEPRRGRLSLNLTISGSLNKPLCVKASVSSLNQELTVYSSALLSKAQKNALTANSIAEKFADLGGTPLHLENVRADNLDPGLFLPLSELKPMRRTLTASIVEALKQEKLAISKADNHSRFVLPNPQSQKSVQTKNCLSILCRTLEQTETALEMGCSSLELEAFRPEKLELMIKAVRSASPSVTLCLAAPRIQKQGELPVLQHLLKFTPDALLLRSIGSLHYLTELHHQGRTIPALHGDFSFNAVNSLTADTLLRLGLDTFTPGDDLDESKLAALLEGLRKLAPGYPASLSPIERLVFTLYRHLPTFHSRHCLYANLLSSGSDPKSCGQPCRKQDLYIIDRMQYSHLVRTDCCCRNTVFDQTPKQRQKLLPMLGKAGVVSFRVELLNENKEQTKKIISYYSRLLHTPLSDL